VQFQDGADFDPTKMGFSSISFGGRFGTTARIEVDGVEDKLFFFLDAEHTNQNLTAPVVVSDPFSAFTANTSAPFRKTDYDARLNWQFKNSLRMFYRFSYFDCRAVSAGGLIGFQPYEDKNYTKNACGGRRLHHIGRIHPQVPF
jgi:hypothetical protein